MGGSGSYPIPQGCLHTKKCHATIRRAVTARLIADGLLVKLANQHAVLRERESSHQVVCVADRPAVMSRL